ncbi:MAG: fumarate/nitrate reduction transcriptional regulator Fnr [Casimicrobiaceae bacterium]
MSQPAHLPRPEPPTTAAVISIRELRTHCSNCTMRELCLPVGLEPEALKQLDQVIARRVRLAKGEPLYRIGETFSALYAIRLGSCKTSLLSDDGREQVAGYHMIGDVIGMDGIGTGRHGCQASALEDSEYCVLPFGELEDLSRRVAPLQRNLHQFLSREIARGHGVMLQLGSMSAKQRLAAFLVNLSQRYRARGYSRTEFVLRMTREEIGSYLGLKLETVSRLFSRFQQQGLIQVHGRVVKVLDLAALTQLLGHHC